MAKSASGIPAPLAKAARRFDAWRMRRTARRIPEELWSLAAELGARYGVSRTARALRLRYYDLKERVEAVPAPAPDETVHPPAFVEILTAPSAFAPECLVEFESPSGAKMRIHVNGAGRLDLAELSRLFLERRS